MKCEDSQKFEFAKVNSDLVFLGKLEKIETVVYDTTHHGEKKYLNGKFKVLKSWKLVNKEYVSIGLPGNKTLCVPFEEGKEYLVFGLKDSEDLHIPIDSRTSINPSVFSQSDLQNLGEAKIIIEGGEFSLQPSPFYEISIAVLIIFIIASSVYFWIKRNI